MGKNEGGSTEGRMDGGREGGIRNWEHLGKLWGVLEGSCGFWGVLESFGRLRVALAGFGRLCQVPVPPRHV